MINIRDFVNKYYEMNDIETFDEETLELIETECSLFGIDIKPDDRHVEYHLDFRRYDELLCYMFFKFGHMTVSISSGLRGKIEAYDDINFAFKRMRKVLQEKYYTVD